MYVTLKFETPLDNRNFGAIFDIIGYYADDVFPLAETKNVFCMDNGEVMYRV